MFTLNLSTETGLNNEDLRTLAPSVFAPHPHARVSARYAFVPTSALVDGLRAEGWAPVWAAEQRIRTPERRGFQKHMLRFARRDDLARAQAERPELVLVNSHDRSSAYQLHAGVFRFVCSNGMILADSVFARVSLTHLDFEPAKVIAASFGLVREMPALSERIADFKAHRLSTAERRDYAAAALLLRWPTLDRSPVGSERLLTPRRYADDGADLWNTFNVVQENLLKGGQKDLARRRPGGARFARTRAVQGLDENVRLNKALWDLTETLRNSRN